MINKIKNYFKGFTKQDYLKWLGNIGLIFIGSVSLAFGVCAFLVPYGIVTGGVSGIAIIVQSVFFNSQNVADIIIVILNVVLFFVGWIFLGKEFATQTLLSIIIYSVAVVVLSDILTPNEWRDLIDLENIISDSSSEIRTFDPRLTALLAAVCGSVFVGTGCALTFKGGGSTGGVDAISFIGQKYLKIKCSVGTFIIDATIIIVGMVVSNDIANGVIGIGGAFVAATMIDKIFVSTSSSFIAFVISDKYQEIQDFIHSTLDRGTTVIDVMGGYTKTDKKMLKLVFDRGQYPKIISFIKKTDPSAFISVTKAHEITGEGFSPIK